ncbi:MAG: GntR family transcriptional regulator [Pelagibacteraceae bacterium]|nr:GntR family transcriptional regulator [Pelagibacteraceae bacterium]|tara:strand:+ start:859 stop:1518 length:660 start_codon:yes stop_codon:yes gene_type:complete
MIQRIGTVNLKGKVYDSLKKYIISLNIYLKETDFHLDERQLSLKLGVSRTPIREAIARLEQEGIVKTIPRRGVFVNRKTKKDLIEIVSVWAGLEGYAAHLIIKNSTQEEIKKLEKFCQYKKENVLSELENYSRDNILFHQFIMKLTKVDLMSHILESQLLHLQFLRKKFIIESKRAIKSIDEHDEIIKSLLSGNATRAEKTLRNHALGLVKRIEEKLRK